MVVDVVVGSGEDVGGGKEGGGGGEPGDSGTWMYLRDGSTLDGLLAEELGVKMGDKDRGAESGGEGWKTAEWLRDACMNGLVY